MLNLSRLSVVILVVAASLLAISCTGKSDPTIGICKDFIKKAATGDKTITDIIDFEAAAQKYGTTEQEVIKNEGPEKWNKIKEDMAVTIISAFSPFKKDYGTAFKDFKVDEKGADYWIVSYLNPKNERKMMMVKKRADKLKTYYYQR